MSDPAEITRRLAERLAKLVRDVSNVTEDVTEIDADGNVTNTREDAWAAAIAADEVLLGVMRYALYDTIDSPAKQMAFAPLTREVDPTS